MPALAPISARKLKAMLESNGYAVIHGDDYTWSMDNGSDGENLVLPKLGEMIALEVMDSLLAKAKITDGKYFELLARVS